MVVRERHRQALRNALVHLRHAGLAAEQGLEFVAEDMRKAALVLAGVTGRVDVEDLLEGPDLQGLLYRQVVFHVKRKRICQ